MDDNNVIYHSGVKGMRWGVRRYQNKDGSLTNLGRSRYRKDPNGAISPKQVGAKSVEKTKQTWRERREAKKAKQAAEKERLAKLTDEQKKEEVLKSRSAEQLYKNAHLFTTNELQTAYNRLQLEANIARLQTDKLDKAKKIANETVVWTKRLGEISTNGINLYNNVAKILNAVNADKPDKKLPLVEGGGGKKKDKKKDDDD